jgi:ribonuclease PH
VAAASAGLVQGEPRLDLTYAEDAAADVDLNVVMTGRGRLVELQGTAERHPFGRRELEQMLRLAQRGIGALVALQRRALGASSLEQLQRGR